MSETDVKAVIVTHRSDRLQVHVAPWADGRAHLHVQNLAGGAGRIVPLDVDDAGLHTDPLARELVDEHDEVRQLVGADDDAEHNVTGWPQ